MAFFPRFDYFSPIAFQIPPFILLFPPFIEAHPRARALDLRRNLAKIRHGDIKRHQMPDPCPSDAFPKFRIASRITPNRALQDCETPLH